MLVLAKAGGASRYLGDSESAIAHEADVDIGTTMIDLQEGVWLKPSGDTSTTGRRPVCSDPDRGTNPRGTPKSAVAPRLHQEGEYRGIQEESWTFCWTGTRTRGGKCGSAERSSDYEDAVTAAAARLAGCHYIVTRDPRGFADLRSGPSRRQRPYRSSAVE